MKNSLASFYACITVTFFFFFFSFHSCLASQLIRRTCRTIADHDPNLTYNFCVASLESNPKSGNASLRELGLIAAELTLANATYIDWYISNKLLKGKKLDPYAEACLRDCHELYSDAVPTLKDAVNDFKRRDYFKANMEVSAAMDASTTCEDGYKERNEACPLTKEDHLFFQLCAIALAFTNMLH